ncbi:unnamed protein product [Chilo suppressalis]|uniref:Chemosensory protein n=1 Tax=Chilo suppressalis TaxID=168631 RepID=A0ABN8L7C6_CHISP|nr:unnamed protein product [Chilo suppressalis]
MQRFIIFLVLGMAAMCLAEETTYTDRFDNVDVDEIIANPRLLTAYIRCVLDQGRCTAEGKELKEHVKDAMQTACKKCTDKQKDGARKVVNHIRVNEPQDWEKLVYKYDPIGEYKPIYEPFLAGENLDKNKGTEPSEDQKPDLVEQVQAPANDDKKADLVEARKTESVEFKKTEVVDKSSGLGFQEERHF